MGYRTRLSKIDKEQAKKYRTSSYEFLEETHNGDFCLDDMNTYEEIKYIDEINISSENFFMFDIKDYGYECSIIDKDVLKLIIEHYEKRASDMYNNLYQLLIQNQDKKTPIRIVSHLLHKKTIWKNDWTKPYTLDKEMSTTGMYEYDIFELIHIYRTFDFDKNYMLMVGW